MGQLSSEAAGLEIQLSKIFETARHWGAILVFDEAEVYLAQRSPENIERSRLVATFLRELEYFSGVLFLTTNQGQSLDQAILSRVHLNLVYKDLNTEARRVIFKQVIEMNDATSSITEDELVSLANVNLNGRQVWKISKSHK